FEQKAGRVTAFADADERHVKKARHRGVLRGARDRTNALDHDRVMTQRETDTECRNHAGVSFDRSRDRLRIGDLSGHEPQVCVGQRKPRRLSDECGDIESPSKCLPNDLTAGLTRCPKYQHIHPVTRAPAGTVTTAAAIASTVTTTA